MSRFWPFLLLAFCGAAWAATSCRFATGIPGVAFGTYDVVSALPTDTQLRVDVQCTRDGGPPNVTVSLGISQGLHGTSTTDRRMRNAAGDVMSYGLFLDSARSAVWGTTHGVDTGSLTLTIPNRTTASGSFLVFGRIPPRQNVSPGSYSDSLQLVVSP